MSQSLRCIGSRTPHHGAPAAPHNSFRSLRPTVLTASKLLVPLLGWASSAAGFPLEKTPLNIWDDGPEGKTPDDPSLWVYLGTAVALVLLGGAFAGLTIALMGQDEIYLQVIATSGEGSERKNAKKVLRLLQRGKHWVLVTLLLSNVITNETLPIVLDRSLGGGWPAVLSSTVLIVIFGEIVPQSICVRYGLPIGAWMSPFVLALMWVMFPIAWPTAKLLDKLLGEDHGTTYKKAGLKTLVTLHKTLGEDPGDRLNQDEVTIISAVLDLKAKAVGSIMTPMDDVFTLSADAVLDEDMMEKILSAGYSRIPIYQPDNPQNFVGMLLVKMLIVYDPEDALRVRDFALATLPETRPETSCLDIVNFFQEGKSHMVLVSDYPAEPYGALGVVTLEDVIEELIGEEIIDESDVFVDVHKAIRRMQPAPRTRVPKGEVVTTPEPGKATLEEGYLDHPSHHDEGPERKLSVPGAGGTSKKGTTFFMRRWSSGETSKPTSPHIQLRSDSPGFREHLKHLGPSNAANKPKMTRFASVKIKTPGMDMKPGSKAPNTGAVVDGTPSMFTIPENRVPYAASEGGPRPQSIHEVPSSYTGGVGEGLLSSAGRDASDGVHVLHRGYGTMKGPATSPSKDSVHAGQSPTRADRNADGEEGVSLTPGLEITPEDVYEETPADSAGEPAPRSDKIIVKDADQLSSRSGSSSTVGSLPGEADGAEFRKPYRLHGAARSGSITEQLVDVGGVKKIVLDLTSSDDTDELVAKANGHDGKEGEQEEGAAAGGDKKKRRKKRSKKGKGKGKEGESEPLLDSQSRE